MPKFKFIVRTFSESGAMRTEKIFDQSAKAAAEWMLESSQGKIAVAIAMPADQVAEFQKQMETQG